MTSRDGAVKVLIADDDAEVRSLVEGFVGELPGFEVVGMAGDADQAMRLSEALEPDVVILDWSMPGGGDRAAQQITRTHSKVRVVAMSAMDHQEASYVMGTAGAVAFVHKPFGRKELIKAIEGAIRW